MMWSRIVAVLLVVAATLWIGSGVLGRTEAPDQSAAEAAKKEAAPLFRVAVMTVAPQMHARAFVLSGRTEADNRASAVTRTAGSIVELKVHRGDVVKQGDVVAVLSDEARLAQVAEAEALVQQRRISLDAKLPLIKRGIVAANEKNELEADLRAAEAALAVATAERDRAEIRAPIAGVVSEVPVSTGQALQMDAKVAEIVALDPMLAVIEVAERQLGGIHVGDSASVKLVTGLTTTGIVRFISPTASEGTRTYRVDVELDNSDGSIADGITAEVELKLAPVEAVRIPRSALTFSSAGELSVRTVKADDTVASVAVAIVQDSSDQAWVTGPSGDDRIIVQGQDFVKDGQKVDAVDATAPALLSES